MGLDDTLRRLENTEFHREDIFKKMHGIMAAASLAGIFEMAGGAPPTDLRFTIAAYCFSVGIAVNSIAYVQMMFIEFGDTSGDGHHEYAKWVKGGLGRTLMVIGPSSALMGIGMTISYFSIIATGLFVGCIVILIVKLTKKAAAQIERVNKRMTALLTEAKAASGETIAKTAGRETDVSS